MTHPETEADIKWAVGNAKRLERDNERLRSLLVQRKSKQGKVAASRNRMAEGVEHWKAEAEKLRTALTRIATDPDVNCLAGNPALWPSTIAKSALNQQLTQPEK